MPATDIVVMTPILHKYINVNTLCGIFEAMKQGNDYGMQTGTDSNSGFFLQR